MLAPGSNSYHGYSLSHLCVCNPPLEGGALQTVLKSSRNFENQIQLVVSYIC